MRKLLTVFVLLLVACLPVTAYADTNLAVADPALFQEIGTYGGELVLGLSSSPRSFNFYGIIDNAAYTVQIGRAHV